MKTKVPFSFLVLLAIVFGVSVSGCSCLRSSINASESVRWWLFSNFGASKICPEMMKRGVPLKFAPLGAASVGRFFPLTCSVQVDDTAHVIVMNVTGAGYMFLPVTRRVGVYAGVSVEFRPDFRLEEDSIYVWGRFNRWVTPPDLRLLGVENPVVSLATQTPMGDVASVVGQSILTSEVARGFTVVKQDDGQTFTLGLLNPPDKPKRQFEPGEGRVLLDSDFTELHSSTREYLGPFAVESGGAALYVTLKVTGAPLEFVVVDKMTGDMWRQAYEKGLPLAGPPSAPLAFGQALIGETKRKIPVNSGMYYVVIENRAPAPTVLGLGLPLPEAVGYASWGVEVGDRD